MKKALEIEGAPARPAEALAGPEAERRRAGGEGAGMRRLCPRLECALSTASRAQRAERAAGVFRQRTHRLLVSKRSKFRLNDQERPLLAGVRVPLGMAEDAKSQTLLCALQAACVCSWQLRGHSQTSPRPALTA